MPGLCFWYTVLCVDSSFAIISLGRGSRLLYFFCLFDVTWLILFFDSSSRTVLRIGLQCMIGAFPGHTNLLSYFLF